MILAITESAVPLSVYALGGLLKARIKQERIRMQEADLLYLLAKRHYKGLTSPSEAAEKLLKPPTKPKPAQSIIKDIVKQLGG